MDQHDALKRHLLDLEQRYWRAIEQRDGRAAAQLSDDPCLVVGAQGVGEVLRAAFPTMLQQANYDLHRHALDDVHVRLLGEDVAILAYAVDEELTVDGEPLKLHAYDSSVWHRRDGEWVCVLHTESPAGDPFGRH
jgi:hypothetical protein